MFRAGIYVRVSTQEQAEEGYSIQSQLDKLKAYCNIKEYILIKEYIDPGFSGANLNRPAITQLIQDVQNKKLDVVLVMKLDRLSRSQKDTLYLIEDVFLQHNCNFISVSESFDTQTPMGRAMIGILSVFAQFERERIRERVQDGKNERAKTGKAMAWSNPPLGYDYANQRYVVNLYEAKIVKTIYDLCLKGLSMNKIKNYIDENFDYKLTKYKTKDGNIHLATIKRVLRNPLYYGALPWKGELYQGIHDALITKEQFDTVQKQLELNAENSIGSRKTPFRSTHLLTGLLYCKECGARMHAQSRRNVNKNNWYYVCYSVSKTSTKYSNGDCKAKLKDGMTLDHAVYEQIENMSNNINAKIKNTNTVDLEKDSLENDFLKKRLKELESKQEKLLELYLDNKVDKDIITTKSKELDNEKQTILTNIKKNKKKSNKLSKAEAKEKITQFIAIYETGELEQKKTILRSIIDRINISENGIEIKWTF